MRDTVHAYVSAGKSTRSAFQTSRFVFAQSECGGLFLYSTYIRDSWCVFAKNDILFIPGRGGRGGEGEGKGVCNA